MIKSGENLNLVQDLTSEAMRPMVWKVRRWRSKIGADDKVDPTVPSMDFCMPPPFGGPRMASTTWPWTLKARSGQSMGALSQMRWRETKLLEKYSPVVRPREDKEEGGTGEEARYVGSNWTFQRGGKRGASSFDQLSVLPACRNMEQRERKTGRARQYRCAWNRMEHGHLRRAGTS